MTDDRAVSTVQAVLAETSWLSVPCPPEYLPALARDVLLALEKAGMAVVQLPGTAGMVNYGLRTAPGRVIDAFEGYTHTPSKARSLAAALLSAADAADAAESSVVAQAGDEQ